MGSVEMTKAEGGFIVLNKCLPFNKIPDYIARLNRDFEVWFTIKRDKELVWTNDISKAKDWQFGIPHIPPKVFFFPGFETLINNSDETGLQVPRISRDKKILFGVHPTDIKALTLLDKLLKDDFYWERRRRQFYIIGMGEFEFTEDSNCDIFLEENGDVFDVYLKNPRANDLISYQNLFSKCVFSSERTRQEFDPLFSDMEKLSKVVEKSYKSKIWDDLAKIELCCGICAYVCPMCYCTETCDNFELNNKTCSSKRERRWSSCFAPDFFEVSGYNFRPYARDRIYNWYHHKFVRMPKEIGHVGCVDCGRCTKYCPAKINFKSVLQSLS